MSAAPASSSSVAGFRAINFNPGPAGLPLSVLQRISSELTNYSNSGASILEMSHRSKEFEAIVQQTKQSLKQLLNIPANYHVVFFQGGGTGQFSAIPLNFLGLKKSAAYLITGSWSKAAAVEAKKYADVKILLDTESKENKGTFQPFPASSQLTVTLQEKVKSTNVKAEELAYVYYCSNETVDGIQFVDLPDFSSSCLSGVDVICDMSSDFCSRPVDVSKFAVIFAGAQKNVGPAGVTIAIVRDDVLKRARADCPIILNYTTMVEKDSMYNTPPCFALYSVGLVLEWIIHQKKGLSSIALENSQKASLLYSILDNPSYSSIYSAKIPLSSVHCRSLMNVTFSILSVDGKNDEKLVNQFVENAKKLNMIGLAGHRSVGGIRASLYNAVTLEDVNTLAKFMTQWANEQLHTRQSAKL